MPPHDPEIPDWSLRFTGPNAQVWMHKRCAEEMLELGKARAKIEGCMKGMYCQMEQSAQIPASKLNKNEGRHGPNKLRVQAFRSGQGRVYGVEGSVSGKRAFFAACATVKKQQKADPEALARAAERVTTVMKVVPGASV